jgi:hypothetical protein
MLLREFCELALVLLSVEKEGKQIICEGGAWKTSKCTYT